MRYHRAVLKGEETVRHEDDTSGSALYSNNLVWDAIVFLSCSAAHDRIIGAAPRGPKCVSKGATSGAVDRSQVGKSHMQDWLRENWSTRASRLTVTREEA